ncbi:MAG TPA: Hsp20/alpha crystallin family protein [Acidimicrobiia bacterium]|jgi:HSP20 family protein|nr:Hsp20/alpha crystallin family protein [Acidimicrobiia bacterium]
MLMRYDPFREIDRFTEGLFGNTARTPWMPMDAVRKGDHVEILFDLPGVRPDSIELTVERNVLTVKAERSWWPEEGAEVLARERTQGTFSRQVLLGEALDAEHVDAHYDQGVLRVTIPVLEKAKPRKVEIHSGDTQSIEVGSTS